MTNLQTNFYPALKGIHYIGRFYNQDNYKLFSDLNDLVDNRKEFTDNEYISLVNNFKEYQKNFKKNLNFSRKLEYSISKKSQNK